MVETMGINEVNNAWQDYFVSLISLLAHFMQWQFHTFSIFLKTSTSSTQPRHKHTPAPLPSPSTEPQLPTSSPKSCPLVPLFVPSVTPSLFSLSHHHLYLVRTFIYLEQVSLAPLFLPAMILSFSLHYETSPKNCLFLLPPFFYFPLTSKFILICIPSHHPLKSRRLEGPLCY